MKTYSHASIYGFRKRTSKCGEIRLPGQFDLIFPRVGGFCAVQKCYLCFLENSFDQFVCDHLIREEFVLRNFSKYCAGTSPKQLAFWINNLTNPLPFKYSMLTRLSNDLEASRRSTKRPILLATTLVTRLSEYVSKRFESCTCRRRN